MKKVGIALAVVLFVAVSSAIGFKVVTGKCPIACMKGETTAAN